MNELTVEEIEVVAGGLLPALIIGAVLLLYAADAY
ncbi:class IIb bacteriocin, lactobin A/cerein 7B family [Ramlibacter sp. MMS24-I3-19]